MPDAPRLAHDPGMQMEHHQPSGGRSIGIKTIEPLAPQQVDLVDGPAAVEVDVVVVEVCIHPERVELPCFRRHLIGLLVLAPVADVANALRGKQVGGVRRHLEVRAGPTDGARARRLLDRLDRGADVLPLLVLRHADMDDAAARETVRDELGVAILALFDQERIVVGDGLVERQGGLDAVFVQYGEDAEDPDTIAVLVVAVAADVGKVRLVSGPNALGASQRGHRQRRIRWHLPVPVLEVDDNGKGDAGVVRPPENRARNDRRPGIELLVHAIGALCGHRSLRLPRWLPPSDWLASDSASEWLPAEEDHGKVGPMRIRFDGKTVAVSGAGHGFGRCIAETFAQRGARVFSCDLSAAELAETATAGVEAEVVDLSDRVAAAAWIARIEQTTGGAVDVLVNNAGGVAGQEMQPIEEIPDSSWDPI